MKKAIALLLVIALLAGGLYYLRLTEQQDKKRMRELYTAVEPLQREREALIAERDGLTEEYAEQMRDAGTVELLFRELNKEIFTDVYPLMRDRGIVGVLGVCTQQYPGFKGRMTIEEYSRLLKDGWGSCFIYERVGQLEDWLNDLSYLLEHDGLPIPKAIFFPDNTFNGSMEPILIRCGIETVILSADDGHSATVTSLSGPIWHTGAMPWNYTGVNSDTELLARTSGANLVFTVSFKNLWDAYEEEAFVKVLDNWTSMFEVTDALQSASEPTPMPQNGNTSAGHVSEIPDPLLKVTNFEEARRIHAEAEAKNIELAEEQTRREAELDKQIADLDAQIRELYDQWGQSGKKLLEFGNEQ
jgi:hypothetical protein